MNAILAIAGGYALGAIPFGVFIARGFYGVRIQDHGSGNTGATNVWRVLGTKAGAPTLALDILKGAAAVWLADFLDPGALGTALGAGLAAIVGHNWSLFLSGRGGKGVATSAGVFLALIPVQTALSIAVFAAVFFTTKRVSVGSLAASFALLVLTLVLPTPSLLRWVVVAAAAMILIKHVPNMKRLARGEEPKVKFP